MPHKMIMRFSSLSFSAGLLLAAAVAGAQSNPVPRQPGCLAGLPFVVLYPDTNHTACLYANGRDGPQATIHTYPDSTTAGLSEIQELFPWTNRAANGFALVLAPGNFYFSTRICLTNISLLKGAGPLASVFRYNGTTNGFTFSGMTKDQFGSSLFCIVTNNQLPNPCTFPVAPSVTFEDFGIAAEANIPAFLLHVDAADFAMDNCFLGSSFSLISPNGADDPMITNAPALVGMYVANCYNNLSVTRSRFENLATGIDGAPATAWISIRDNEFLVIGADRNGFETAWPAGSVYDLGACIIQFNNYGWFSAARNEMYHCKSMVFFKSGPGQFSENPGEKCQYAVLADPAAVADVSLTTPGKSPVTPVISGPAGCLIDSNHVQDVPEVYVTSSGHGGGDPDGGIYGWSISENNTRIFGFENSGGFDNFNNFFINQNYPLFANGAGLNSVPPSAIVGGVLQTNSAAVMQTNFISGCFYTNHTTSMQMVFATIQLTAPGGPAVSEMDLVVTNPGAAFSVKAPARLVPSSSSPGGMSTMQLTLPVPSGSCYYFTNLGNATIVPGTGILKID